MSDILQHIYLAFWSEKFWLPSNVSWDFLDSRPPNVYYPHLWDLMHAFYIAIVILILRPFTERCIWKPIGQYFGLRDRKARRVLYNETLEKLFKWEKRPNQNRVGEIAALVHWPTNRVEHWFRQRRNQDKSSLLTKFVESGWRLVYYIVIFAYGLYILWDKPFLWDSRQRWIEYPYQHITDDVYWYYMIELGYYFAGVICSFSDVKRKDFFEMLLHHLATIILMMFSWVTNFVRIGAVVLCTHDSVDYFMEIAKMAKYVHKDRLCDAFFVIFTVTFFITRLVYYPFWVVNSAIFDCAESVGFFWSHYLFIFFLLVLQVLHVFWFYLIMRIAAQVLTKGQLEHDSRSDSEMSHESSSEEVESVADGVKKVKAN